MKSAIPTHWILWVKCTAAVLALICLASTSGDAAKPASGESEPVDIFAAMEAGDIDVKLIVKNIEEARIVAKNNTDRPLTIKIPDAIAAVPALAQNQGGGNQGGVFNVPPEKVAKHDVKFVCLEHGKPDPRSTMQYTLRPIEEMTTNPLVIEVIHQLGKDRYGHRASQAAVWHLQNGLTWQQLANKRRRHANGVSRPYFSPLEIRQAMNITKDVTRIVQQREKPTTGSESLAQ